MIIGAVDTTLQIALLYSIQAIAVILAFRVIGFPDLTPDGSFTLGASVSGVLLLSGVPSWIAMIVSLAMGAFAGMLTALLHTRLRVSKLLSGILLMLILYSVSLRIMGTSNLSLMNADSFISSLVMQRDSLLPLLVISSACLFVYLAVCALLWTPVGLRLRATGDSSTALELRGLPRESNYILGLAIVNAISGWAGSLVAQYQGFVDVSMGGGLVIISLAAIVMGETLIRPERVGTLMLAPIAGMVIYQGIVAIALRLGLAAADLKVTTAILALVFIGMDRIRSQYGSVTRQIGNRSI
ncbi:MAG: ABC transporter permease [Proteobacteria bacterium]|nr:ABC transporter permease [Pseudomonadota bacterium]